MRILHTSDWHLGRTLEGRPRLPEQVEFIGQLCDIADEYKARLVLVAGDVFDAYNPSAEAEALFFDAMERLAQGGDRAVVVVAGNHDSPDRLRASNPLARKHGISIIGYPGESLDPGPSAGATRLVSAGPGWMEIAVSGSAETAIVYTLAYASESRLNEVISENLDDVAQQSAYSARIGRLLEEAERAFRPDTVNLLVGHIFAAGGRESESERPIQLGGALAVPPQSLPAGLHYIALGHLHRPQPVSQARAPCRYSGSPLTYSFSEADQQKEVVIVDASPGIDAVVTPVGLTCGKPLKRWQAADLGEVYEWCKEPGNLQCWLELEVKAEQPLTAAQLAELHALHPGVVSVRVILPEAAGAPHERRLSDMSLAEQFRLFFSRQRGGSPPQTLVDFFLELVNRSEQRIRMEGTEEPSGGAAP